MVWTRLFQLTSTYLAVLHAPEAFLYGMMQLQRIVKVENFFGTTNRKQKDPFKLAAEEKEEQIYTQEEEA